MGENSESSRDEANKLDERADDVASLLSAFSHDFATPLANIKLAAEVLVSAEGRIAQDKLVQLGQNISTEADRLRRMIDTLLEWNRLETGKRQLRLEWHLVEDLVGSALRRLGPLLDDQQVVVTIEPDLAFIRGDEVLVEAVLVNLLDNAAHCTPKTSPVEVRVEADDTQCRVEILDAGPSFEDEEEVFVDARCSARTGQTSAPGGGLGLVVSRRIIEAHGGQIWARNRNDQPGAAFAFVLGYGGEAPPHYPVDAAPSDDGTD